MSKRNKQEKLFIIRKYVRAFSVADALKKEKGQDPDDCWMDDKFFEQVIVKGFIK